MRVLSRNILRHCWESHSETEQPLKAWFAEVERARWRSISDVKPQYPRADCTHDERVVFRIGGDAYRAVLNLWFPGQAAFVGFAGTRAEYASRDVAGQAQQRESMAIDVVGNDDEHGLALNQIKRLWGARRGTETARQLEALIEVAESYEKKAHAIAPPSPIQAVRFRLEQ